MKIALIWPKGFDTSYVLPISLGYLKSNLPPKHEIRIFDCSFHSFDYESRAFINKLKDFNPDVAGVSCWSSTYPEAINILKKIKSANHKITTVIGGPHPTCYADKTFKNECVDFLFRGEAELSFPIFIEELEKTTHDWSRVPGLTYKADDGTIKNNEMQHERDLDKSRIPDYDAIDLDGYIENGYNYCASFKRNAPIWVTRGCPYRCAFCSAPIINGRRLRRHSLDYVIEWIKYLYYEKGIKLINIIDDNFTLDVRFAKEFCKSIISLEIKDLQFNSPNGIRVQRSDKELFVLMKKAGWEYVSIAPESGSVKTLRRMKKDLDIDIIPEKVKEICDAGMKVHGLFMVGYPGETMEDIKATEKLLRKCRFDMVYIANFQPLPGTPVYDELVKAGEIDNGLLAKNVSGGERAYTPDTLRNFNFSKFILVNYLYVMLSNPKKIPYMLRLFSPAMVIKKVFANLKNMISINSANKD